ncbi:MAG: quinolinate synthase NadA [Lentisphaerae bacterium]|jgi:quinolinate synthase|nr:quinolinate synthase NadA [Lentisphaerota bacterium]MBT4818284.1 quinolinate synthase NadA [Lentisphaerota bacterium]MBT5612099.1 quinolinate synthase NadA [Lentisphaerota bacterium]MBT7060561.1 quinolinate synthase NadA [Lentisphaerota bacterium]MBT7840674.1 quinolinate synthase NadA [Lentisphaerota bacterium]
MSNDIAQQIQDLKQERNAIILAHNYQPGEVQDIADFVGDSLELSRKAAEVEDADVIVFCGVHFMAETAAILSPEKTVLLPDPLAGCPMADMINGDQLRELKAKHPGAAVVCYVNSTADVKAESDCCCTSANAVQIINSFPKDQDIIFVPDQYLGDYVAERTGRELIFWPGYCPSHAKILDIHIARAREEHPGAVVITHPECARPTRDAADEILSTGGMVRIAAESDATEFIVATETGMLHRLRKDNPGKSFYPATEACLCPNMKKIRIEKVLWALQDTKHVIQVKEPIRTKAESSIRRMLEVCAG